MIPYAELIIQLMQQQERIEQRSHQSIHFFANPTVLAHVNVVWAGFGICVVLGNLIIEAWVKRISGAMDRSFKKARLGAIAE